MKKTNLLLLIFLITLVGGYAYFERKSELSKNPSRNIEKESNQNSSNLLHKKLLDEEEYRFYYEQTSDSSHAKRLYRAEMHITNMMRLKELYESTENVGLADSSYTKNGKKYIRFIFGLKSDPNHKYAYDITKDDRRTYVYEVDPNIEFKEKIPVESNLPKMNTETELNVANTDTDYNTERWRKKAFNMALRYLQKVIPNSEPECKVTSQGIYQPKLVSYYGRGVFKVIAPTSFDCDNDYINRKVFFITMVHYPEGWDATVTGQKFLD
ncbi:hypothetical protein [Marixanthomonas spongiae]|uniref:Uncharacterized protein n=1 Tax=Marixanthomonas spongiae TaxID=2174845 RepID=A0A2U0HZT0_9FLAO|nr:hypothetical protein [Marixanthomonas spongiae]PVW14338.1 hypothetical protein DDV96_11105 [Marixanthomonas spongiae]